MFYWRCRQQYRDSLLIGGAKMGMDVRLCAPKVCWPHTNIQQEAQRIASTTGARIMITEDIDSAVAGVDFVYTDVWVSMGEPEEKWAERIKLLLPYQVNTALMEKPAIRGRTSCTACRPSTTPRRRLVRRFSKIRYRCHGSHR